MQSTIDKRNGHGMQNGPSDREIVAYLQRLASARAQLLQAEQAAQTSRPYPADTGSRNHELEDAHAEVLWAQAGLLTGQKESRAQRLVEQAKERERQLLRRYGFNAFREYLDSRTTTPTQDIHLEVARREYESAKASWEALQQALGHSGPGPGGVVLDLTGDHPRRIA